MYWDSSLDHELDTYQLIVDVEKTAVFSSIISEDTKNTIFLLQNNIKNNTKIHGSEHPITLEQLLELAELYTNNRIYNCTCMILHRTSLGLKRCYGKDHYTVPLAMSRLAYALMQELKYSESIECYKEALRGFELIYGHSHELIAAVLDGLGYNYMQLHNPVDSEMYYRRLLDYYSTIYNKEHPSTLNAVTRLAEALQAQGNNIEANKLCSSSLDSCISILGENHPTTQTSVITLAQVKHSQGKIKQAEKLYRKALKCNEEVLGYNNAKTLENVELIGDLLSDQYNYLAAEAMYRRALRGYQDNNNSSDEISVKIVSNIYNIGVMLVNQMKPTEALEYLIDSYEQRSNYYGVKHPKTLEIKFMIGKAYYYESLWRHKLTSPMKNSNAISTLKETLDGYDQVLGLNNKSSIKTLDFLISILIESNLFIEAEEYTKRLFLYREKELGLLHSDTTDTAYTLATIYEHKSNFKKAAKLFKISYDGYQIQLEEINNEIKIYQSQSNYNNIRNNNSNNNNSLIDNDSNNSTLTTYQNSSTNNNDNEIDSINNDLDSCSYDNGEHNAPPKTPMTPGEYLKLEEKLQKITKRLEECWEEYQSADRRSKY